ncbi:CNOT4 [Dirofilaria immitis]|nr:CNOT4 [Dirofilaria immitis]
MARHKISQRKRVSGGTRKKVQWQSVSSRCWRMEVENAGKFFEVRYYQTTRKAMSSDEQSDKECPLCMEPLEIDDINFFPCKCEYQICRFCWHRLRTDENGLCPACRQPYPEDPVNFKPLTALDVQKIKTEKRQKQQQQKIKICESRKHLSSYRVLQKNLVYVVGLSARVADPETLKKPEYFGKYGRILKVAVGSSPSLNGPQSASCTAYVTYARYEDALRAIQAVNNAQLDGRIVKASLGTTKYCTNFLRSQPCYKPECMYLHDVADTEVSFTKDDMHLGRHAEYEKRLIESTLREKSQRGRASVMTNTSGKPSKSESAEYGLDFRSTPIENNRSKGKISQSRSPSSDKNMKKTIKQTNGEVSENQSYSMTNNKLISENKGADKENEARSQLEKILGTTNDVPSSVVLEEQAVIPTTKVNEGIDSRQNREFLTFWYMTFFLEKWGFDRNLDSKSRLSEWISSSQSVVPLIATTCDETALILGVFFFGDVFWKIVSDSTVGIIAICCFRRCDVWTKEKVDMSNAKVPSNSNSLQSANNTAPCDWQRALGIYGKVDNFMAKNAITEFPTALSGSQTRILPKSTRLSVHSDDDLGFDPISESAKGLADLLEEEKLFYRSVQHKSEDYSFSFSTLSPAVQSVSGMTSVSSSLMSLGLQCGWPSMGISNGTSSVSLRNALGTDFDLTASATNNLCANVDCFSQPLKLSSQTAQTFTQQLSSVFHTNQYSPHPYFPPPKPQVTRGNNLMNPPTNLAFNSTQPQRCPSFNGNTQYHSNISLTAANQIDGTKLHEWQEGFRALLPNVNVRFVPDLGTAGYPPSRASPMEMQRTTNLFSSTLNYDQTMPMSAQLLNPMTSSAPPPVPSINSYSHPSQQWMMPPPDVQQRLDLKCSSKQDSKLVLSTGSVAVHNPFFHSRKVGFALNFSLCRDGVVNCSFLLPPFRYLYEELVIPCSIFIRFFVIFFDKDSILGWGTHSIPDQVRDGGSLCILYPHKIRLGKEPELNLLSSYPLCPVRHIKEFNPCTYLLSNDFCQRKTRLQVGNKNCI